MTVISVVTQAQRIYKIAKAGYGNYNRANLKYNPIAKFETRLPPNYRKPYRIGLRVGDAILSGGLIYDAMKAINDDQIYTPSAGKIRKGRNNMVKSRTGRGYGSGKYRHCNCRKRPKYRR